MLGNLAVPHNRKKKGLALRTTWGAILGALLSVLCVAFDSSGAAEDGGLFLPTAQRRAAADRVLLLDRAVTRSREAAINWPLASAIDNAVGRLAPGAGARVELNLFDDAHIVAVIERREQRADKRYTWFGYVEGDTSSEVTLVIENDIVTGNIHVGGRQFQVRYAGADSHVLREIDPASFPPDGEPLATVAPARRTARDDISSDDGSRIDVMVLYTSTARAAAGSNAAMEALIQLAVAETNTAYARSGVIPRIRLVHSGEVVGYNETGILGVELNRLRNPSDGLMDEVHALRDSVGADMVALIVEGDGSLCGIAYLMTTLSADFASSAFSVSARNCATGNFTFGHELGHNMGLQHDRLAAPADGVFPHSHGYADNAHSFRDIMGVASSCGNCPRIQNFSNPNVNFNGFPTGIAQEQANSADAAASINTTAFTVANWRAEVASGLTVAPSSFDFGSVAVGASASSTFMLTNSGATTISGVASTNAPFSILSGAAYTLAAGQSQTVAVRFAPTAAGSYLGNASFSGAGGASASLSGIGIGLGMTVNPIMTTPGATVAVNWSNIPSPTPTDWIALYAAGQPNTNFITWTYVNCTKQPSSPIASGSCPFTLPASLNSGNYEFRLLANNGFTTLASAILNIEGLPMVTIVASDPNAAEAGLDSGVFSISRTGGTATALTVRYTMGGSATNGTDYALLDGSVTIPAGSTAASLTVTPVDDGLVEGNETVIVTIAASAAYLVGSPSSATVTIIDNDTPSMGATIAANPTSAVQGASITAVWSGIDNPAARDWIGLFSVGGGSTAFWTWIYVGCSQTPASPRAAGSCSFTIPANLANGVYELRLFRNDSFTLLARSAPISVGNSGLPVVNIIAVNAAVEPNVNGQFIVSRSGNTTNSLTVGYSVGGTASNGVDYLLLAGAVEIPADAPSVALPVMIFDDTIFEGDETVVVTLTANAAYAVGTPGSATVIITDNEAPTAGPTLQATPPVVNRGASVAAVWSGIANPSATDWLGLYAPGGSNTQFLAWLYVNCLQSPTTSSAAGSCALTVPAILAPGTYLLRLLANDGFHTIATSGVFTVN